MSLEALPNDVLCKLIDTVIGDKAKWIPSLVINRRIWVVTQTIVWTCMRQLISPDIYTMAHQQETHDTVMSNILHKLQHDSHYLVRSRCPRPVIRSSDSHFIIRISSERVTRLSPQQCILSTEEVIADVGPYHVKWAVNNRGYGLVDIHLWSRDCVGGIQLGWAISNKNEIKRIHNNAVRVITSILPELARCFRLM